jgi:hypothetical protein
MLASHEQAKSEPERAAHGTSALAGVQVCAVRAFKGLQVFIVPTDQVCRHRKPFEILGSQRRFLIGQRKRFVGVTPCPELIVLPAALEMIAALSDVDFPSRPIWAVHVPAPDSSGSLSNQRQQHCHTEADSIRDRSLITALHRPGRVRERRLFGRAGQERGTEAA